MDNEQRPEFDEMAWRGRICEADACIVSHRQRGWDAKYYWLANDGRGNPIPYNMLSDENKALFDLRVSLPTADVNRCAERGIDWHFECPSCGQPSFFTYRNATCNSCLKQFDANLEIVVPPPVVVEGMVVPLDTVTVDAPYSVNVRLDFQDMAEATAFKSLLQGIMNQLDEASLNNGDSHIGEKERFRSALEEIKTLHDDSSLGDEVVLRRTKQIYTSVLG